MTCSQSVPCEVHLVHGCHLAKVLLVDDSWTDRWTAAVAEAWSTPSIRQVIKVELYEVAGILISCSLPERCCLSVQSNCPHLQSMVEGQGTLEQRWYHWQHKAPCNDAHQGVLDLQTHFFIGSCAHGVETVRRHLQVDHIWQLWHEELIQLMN
jgi:hypothetical protein